MNINDILKKYLNDITQLEIEKATGISQSKLSLILNNKRKLTAEELITIAIEFNIDLNKIKEIKNCH